MNGKSERGKNGAFHKYDLMMKRTALKLVAFLLKSGKFIPPGGTDGYTPNIKELRPLEVEIPLGEKVILDKLFIVTDENGEESLLNVEFQSRNDPYMFNRIMLYQIAVLKKYGKFASQIVIYVGKDRVNMENKRVYNKFGTVIHYEYTIIDFRELPAGLFLNSGDPELIPFALLTECDDYALRIKTILDKLKEIRGNDRAKFHKDITNISILSQLRDADRIFKEILKKEGRKLGIEIDIRKNAFFIEGFEEGKKQGFTEGKKQGFTEGILESALRLAERKFGPEARRRIEELLKEVTAVNPEKLFDRVAEAEKAEEVIGFMKKSG